MTLLTIILTSLLIMPCQYSNMDTALVVAESYMNGDGVVQSEATAIDVVVDGLLNQPSTEMAVQHYNFRIVEVLKPRNARVVFDRVKDKSPTARRLADIIRNRGF